MISLPENNWRSMDIYLFDLDPEHFRFNYNNESVSVHCSAGAVERIVFALDRRGRNQIGREKKEQSELP